MQPTMESQKGFLGNDRKLVCSMFAFYGLCILGAIVATVWGLDRRSRTISAHATSTAFALGTEQAKVTATAAAYLTEQDQYEYIERFDKVSGDWYVGIYDQKKQYGDTKMSIKDGAYVWEVTDSRDFTQAIDFSEKSGIKDFDVYVDTKVVEGPAESAVCSGFFFRRSTIDWTNGAYLFNVCNNGVFGVYYLGQGKWESVKISNYEPAIQHSGWNRIEIKARGPHFQFIVNRNQIFEMNDERAAEGSLGLCVTLDKGSAAVVWFDNFGFQSR